MKSGHLSVLGSSKAFRTGIISRDGPYFGFKIPGEQDKYFYVWLDAPIGYIAATEHYCARLGNCKIEEYWLDPAQTSRFITSSART